MKRASLAALAAIAALFACHKPAPPTPPKPATRAELLAKLVACHGEDVTPSTPGCTDLTKLDMTPLNGISIAELMAALGPRGRSQGEFHWQFFTLGLRGEYSPAPPLLICDADERSCVKVRWVLLSEPPPAPEAENWIARLLVQDSSYSAYFRATTPGGE